jgi:AbrB family looped-hinge helix DNA binding protein
MAFLPSLLEDTNLSISYARVRNIRLFLHYLLVGETPLTGKVLGACKISTKGQVTIPSDARKRFQLTVGDLILFIEEDGKLILRKG